MLFVARTPSGTIEAADFDELCQRLADAAPAGCTLCLGDRWVQIESPKKHTVRRWKRQIGKAIP